MSMTPEEARKLRELLNAPPLADYDEDAGAKQRAARVIWEAKKTSLEVARVRHRTHM